MESQDLSSPPLSKPDQAWMDEGLEFVYTREGVSVAELNDLFQKVHLQGDICGPYMHHPCEETALHFMWEGKASSCA